MNYLESEIEVQGSEFLRQNGVGSSAEFMSGDLGRPIININLGNQPVENLQITSVANKEETDSKAPMMIHVSYMPKNAHLEGNRSVNRSREQLQGMLGLKQLTESRNLSSKNLPNNHSKINMKKAQHEVLEWDDSGHGGSPTNLVKSILSKRKRKNRAFDKKWGNQKRINGDCEGVIYSSYDHRMIFFIC